jgi:hypothetical protein
MLMRCYALAGQRAALRQSECVRILAKSESSRSRKPSGFMTTSSRTG